MSRQIILIKLVFVFLIGNVISLKSDAEAAPSSSVVEIKDPHSGRRKKNTSFKKEGNGSLINPTSLLLVHPNQSTVQ
jgi:hypothetical protein